MVYTIGSGPGAQSGKVPLAADSFVFVEDAAAGTDPTDQLADCTLAQLATAVAGQNTLVTHHPFLLPTGTGTQTRESWFSMPVAGTITAIKLVHNEDTTLNASDYWTVMPQNRGAAGTGTTALLAAAWSGETNTIVSGVLEDLGTLANTTVAAGDMINVLWTATGTPTDYSAAQASLVITITPS